MSGPVSSQCSLALAKHQDEANAILMSKSRNNAPLLWLAAPLVCFVILLSGCNKGGDGGSQVLIDQPPSTPPQSKLQRAFELHQQGESAEALKIVQEVLIASPENLAAIRLAIELNDRLGQFCEAAELATKIAEADQQNAASILIRAFDWHLRCGDFAAAERNLNRAAELAPNVPQVHRSLAQLLNAQGRRYEASKHVRELIRLRVIQPNELLSLVDLRGPFSLVSFDELIDDSKISLFSLARARHQYVARRSDPQEDLALVGRVTEKFPDSAAAAAFHGRVLAETVQLSEFRAWLTDLPAGIQEQPEYWCAIGMWLAHEDRHQEAIRAFGEALRRDPSDRESLRTMISSLVLIGKEEQASALRDRLADLDQIFRIAKDANQEQARWISQTLQKHIRPWESAAWLMHSAQLGGQLQQLIPDLNKRHAAIVAWEQDATAERIREVRLERMLVFDIEQWPMPNLDAPASSAPPLAIADLSTGLRFEDVADQVGIATQFDSGFPLDGGELFPYQTNGGGLAALDYDLDGRCDVYVVQSGGKPNDPLGSTANQLLRHLPDQRFAEVTASSDTGDRSFGQGVCAGDVNQDGFPDLLIANIGANVLYINQGDGTFSQASHLISENPDRWTSSFGLADLSGDHLPEIIEINYIDDPQAYVVTCKENYLDCQPQQFRKCADRVHEGLSDGTFQPWLAAPEMRDEPKLGFGLVIANFDRQHGNDFFVSNDGDLNHYWTSTTAPESSSHRFELVESGGARGCSIGRGGGSQACMGVASGDFNRDGTLDLHITNFHNESVNLFMQTQSGFFSDEALMYRLTEPSFAVLGFGTQAADFDNDGWLDLAVLNGHVFDGRFEGIPFRMQAQLMRGSRGGFAPAGASIGWCVLAEKAARPNAGHAGLEPRRANRLACQSFGSANRAPAKQLAGTKLASAGTGRRYQRTRCDWCRSTAGSRQRRLDRLADRGRWLDVYQ